MSPFIKPYRANPTDQFSSENPKSPVATQTELAVDLKNVWFCKSSQRQR